MPLSPDTLRVWETLDTPDDAFASAWNRRLERAPHHNFSMRLDHLRWEAAQAHSCRAVLVDAVDFRAAFVLRRVSPNEWHSGWPWRWQAVVEDRPLDDPRGLTPTDAVRLFESMRRVAHPGRVRFFTAFEPPAGVAGYAAGRTLMQRLTHTDAEFLAAMDAEKRRTVRRARDRGCEVVEARTPDLWRAFAQVQVDTKRRHGEAPPQVAESPAPGMHWREWEHPWMLLLVAVREGRVVSGFGLGLAPGGVLEGRTSATSEEGRKLGAFPLLVHAASVHARDLGYQWHNNGGDTFFKRDMLGRLAERVTQYAWLGGGKRWRIVNDAEAFGRRLAQRRARASKR